MHCTQIRSRSTGMIPLISLFLSFSGEFKIVKPYPKPIYPIEHSSAKVTCVAYDAAGEKIPEKIMFKRVDNFNTYYNLTADGNLYFTGRTEGRMKRWLVKLNVMNYKRGRSSSSCLAWQVASRYDLSGMPGESYSAQSRYPSPPKKTLRMDLRTKDNPTLQSRLHASIIVRYKQQILTTGRRWGNFNQHGEELIFCCWSSLYKKHLVAFGNKIWKLWKRTFDHQPVGENKWSSGSAP